jgi:broad specificity phosphatase PhoE
VSTLYLIRHGQASFGADDYDVLSETGIAQSRLLGTYLAEIGRGFDAVYSGPRQRQRDTASHMRDAARAQGFLLPEPVILDDLDEYPFEAIMKRTVANVNAKDSALAGLISALGEGAGSVRERRAEYEALFQLIMQRWIEGELELGELESYRAFVARIRRGLASIMEREKRGKTICAISSAGAISISVMAATGVSDDTAFKLGWAMANTAISELRYRDRELSLAGFNALPHVRNMAMVTYR